MQVSIKETMCELKTFNGVSYISDVDIVNNEQNEAKHKAKKN